MWKELSNAQNIYLGVESEWRDLGIKSQKPLYLHSTQMRKKVRWIVVKEQKGGKYFLLLTIGIS